MQRRELDPGNDQAEINQSANHAKIQEEQYVDKMIEMPVVLQRQVPTAQTVHKTVEIHQAQFIDTDVNISVNVQRQVPTERKTVEVAQVPYSITRSLRCQV